MLFSSPVFLFLFLPLVLLGYYFANDKIKNYWLLLSSLIFFAWGGASFTVILLISIALNYWFGLKVFKHRDNKKRSRRWLIVGVATNLLILGVFKYANFIVFNLNNLFDVFSIPEIPQTKILLPIGISFYTFHSLSYLVDIYRGKTSAQRNIFDLSLYIAMFSQLIAGPIIRYSDVWKQLRERTHSLKKFSSGVERFLIGLGKKVLLANTFARVADDIFAADPGNLGAINAWLGIICYTFQIYLDFSGYSDMAIGLGRMFGFEFLENFNFPYIARSIKDFWRRWHMSLSSFFRDYVYIPLGGSRLGERRTYMNLLLVFFLTGFWHGASWSFVVWGLFHGFFLILERLGFSKVLEKSRAPLPYFYTMIVVMFGWVLFRADTLQYALRYYGAMFDFKMSFDQLSVFFNFINLEFIVVLFISLLGSFGFFSYCDLKLQKVINHPEGSFISLSYAYHTLSTVFYGVLLILCTMYLISGTYNPFIYYRF